MWGMNIELGQKGVQRPARGCAGAEKRHRRLQILVLHSESPKALACIDWHVSYISSIFGIINETEVEAARFSFLQVCSKQRSRQS